MGKVSTLTHLPLEAVCEDYFFLNQAGEDFKHGLDSILTDTPKLVASFDEADVMPSLVSLGLLFSLISVSDTFRLELAPSIKSHKLWCQHQALL